MLLIYQRSKQVGAKEQQSSTEFRRCDSNDGKRLFVELNLTADDGCVFLVMPLLEGETVRARWERGKRRLPVDHPPLQAAIAKRVPPNVRTLGVFVSSPASTMLYAATSSKLRLRSRIST